MKRRILNNELAALVAQIRHGEMIFIADVSNVAFKTFFVSTM